jgi:hypothetical protein
VSLCHHKTGAVLQIPDRSLASVALCWLTAET